MTAGLTLDQMLRVPFIMGLIRRYHAPGNAFSQFYKLGLDGRVAARILGRAGQYDIFDGTRSLAPMSTPYSPPTRLNKKPIGSVPITVPRMYLSVGIEDEKVFGIRALGRGAIAPTDSGGAVYIAEQAAFVKQRILNSIEFMSVKMFQGGWGVKAGSTANQDLVLCEKSDGAAVYVNDTRIPASNINTIATVSGVDGLWTSPSTDILGQLMALQKNSAKINGRRLKHIWVNGTIGAQLFKNTAIQAVGGSVYRIFDTLNPNKEIGPNQKFPDTGVTVQFRGLPDYLFHIYNQGYVTPGTTEVMAAQTGGNWTPFIPDNIAIITPDPGDWCGVCYGSEPMQWSLRDSRSQTIYGYGMGLDRSIDPPSTEIKFLYNGAPIITEPNAVYYLTVG